MKIVKIALVFVALVAAIFLISQWNNIIDSGDNGGEVITEYVDVDKKCNDIRKAWSKETNWNASLFKEQRSELDQDKKIGRYEFADEPPTVDNAIREQATNKIYDGIFREFHSAGCDDKVVAQNYGGVGTLLAAYPHMKDNARITKVRTVKKVYDDITSFVRSPHTITAKYNSSDNSWVSFSAASQRIINTAASYRNNATYSEDLSNIERFKDGLNDTHIRQVVNSQENKFYRDLSSQIISYFNDKASTDSGLTETNLARFNNASDKYTRETTLYSKEITQAYRAFKKKYEEKMKEQEQND